LQTVLDAEEFLEESLCIDVLRDTLRGLQFLHLHSIAHLDIKVFKPWTRTVKKRGCYALFGVVIMNYDFITSLIGVARTSD